MKIQNKIEVFAVKILRGSNSNRSPYLKIHKNIKVFTVKILIGYNLNIEVLATKIHKNIEVLSVKTLQAPI